MVAKLGKKPSLTLNLGTNGLKVTSQPPPMVGQASCMQGQDRSAVTHLSSSHARHCLIRLSCDNRCTVPAIGTYSPYQDTSSTMNIAGSLTLLQYSPYQDTSSTMNIAGSLTLLQYSPYQDTSSTMNIAGSLTLLQYSPYQDTSSTMNIAGSLTLLQYSP
ncbi:hypothetical protein J6590_001102 [Homalodisca vitripennis]|nr:hypothetical protein J6590_001102 [Homalodisca vitripennis]